MLCIQRYKNQPFLRNSPLNASKSQSAFINTRIIISTSQIQAYICCKLDHMLLTYNCLFIYSYTNRLSYTTRLHYVHISISLPPLSLSLYIYIYRCTYTDIFKASNRRLLSASYEHRQLTASPGRLHKNCLISIAYKYNIGYQFYKSFTRKMIDHLLKGRNDNVKGRIVARKTLPVHFHQLVDIL